MFYVLTLNRNKMSNIRKSLDYFPFAVDFFQDRKVKRLQRMFQEKGLMIYIYILTEIYRDEGYYLEWDDDYPEDIAEVLGENFEADFVREVVDSCVNRFGLFDQELFNTHNILTSKGIQKRYLSIKEGIQKRNLDVKEVFPHFRLVGEDIEFAETSPHIGANRRTSAQVTANQRESAQIGVNRIEENRIEENRIENNISMSNDIEKTKKFVKPTIEEIKQYAEDYLKEKGFLITFNAEHFFDFYESKGWFVGKNKMKDWKAALRNWINTDNKKVPYPIATKTVTLNEKEVFQEFLNGK